MSCLRSLFCAWLVLAIGLAAKADEPKGSRPNIVLILADDLGWGDVSFNGRAAWATPNLDRLASQGRQLNRFYAGSVTCAPSRAVLLTGRYSIHNGVTLNHQDLPAGEVTLAEALKNAGYATALFGKWHHGRTPAGQASYTHPIDQGFEQFFGFTNAEHAWQKFPEELWDGRAKVPVSGHADDLFTDRAVNFIDQHQDRPFFLYLPYISAHFNIEAPAEEVSLHKGKFVEADPESPLNATYAAMITRFDRNVGRVLAALDAANLASNTLVFFTSDHGATFESGNQGTSNFHDSNSPFRGQKRTLWEGGIRVPACVRWPGKIMPGTTSDEPMHAIDLWPTLLAAAGVNPPAEVKRDGVNLLPAWTGQQSAPERILFWEWRTEGTDQVAAMRGPWKLVISSKGNPELFQVVNDPAERRNAAAQHPEIVKELKAALNQWLETENRMPDTPSNSR